MSPDSSMTSQELLRWYVEAGVDETIADRPVDRFQEKTKAPEPKNVPAASPTAAESGGEKKGLADAAALSPAPSPSPSPPPSPREPSPEPSPGPSLLPPEGGADGEVTAAVHLAQSALTVDELRRALESFDGCGLKKTATNLVFTDGNPEAPVLFVGEGPGAEEDRQGLPFVGPSGKLLDRMLASIGLDRTGVLISNTVFWRPPGNRTPTAQETAVCLPFLERLIELVDPKVLVALGGPAAKSLLAQTEGVGRLRGRWFTYSTPGLPRPIDATAMFHPAYLLRSPGQKRDTWRDLLDIKKKLVS
ncbi:MAG: uracil-DNA glycosylase [Rhodospirillaceae bacterium]|jgi:DNA polymerase|nr:uracil-DNA glycosylase [Rhodospirillaceae bacterium]